MADENKNTSQNPGTGATQAQAKDQLEALKEFLKLQGDYKNIVKDSIKELQATLKSYDKMEAKLATINRSAINVKDIESQIKRVEEDRYLNTKKLADLGSKISEPQKESVKSYIKALNDRYIIEQNIINAQKDGNEFEINLNEQKLQDSIELIAKKENLLNIDQLAYAQSLKTDELTQEILTKQEAQLKKEKELRSEIGYTGAALGLFAKNLGIADKYFEEIIEKARKAKDEGINLGFFDKLGILAKAGGSAIKEAITDPLTAIPLASKGIETVLNGAANGAKKFAGAITGEDGKGIFSDMASSFSGMLKSVPIVGGLLGGVVDLFGSFADYATSLASKMTVFGRQLGISEQEAIKLNNQFSDFSAQTNNVLINSQKMRDSQLELGKSLGVNNVLSKEILATNILLKDVAGLEEDTRTAIAESATITGKSAETTTKSILAQVVGLKAATGISFNYKQILGEASKLGGYLGLSFAKYPAQLAKALVTTKALGLDLKQLDSMADSFLDFESSISKEFEAQLLTGKELNLSKARELFLNNDLAGAAMEINKQVGNSGEFLKMNRIQAESLAQAFGMSRDQLGDMLKKQELLSKIGAKDTDNSQKQLQIGLQKYKNQENLVAAIGEEAYQNMVNASAQERLAGFMDKIKTAFADFVTNSPLIPMVEKAIKWLSSKENIAAVVTFVKDAMATLFDVVGKTAAGIMRTLNFFGATNISEDLINTVDKGGASIRAMNYGSLAGNVSDASIKGTQGSSTEKSDKSNQASNKMQFQGVVINNSNITNLDYIRIHNDTKTNNIGKIN